jgi:dynein heavy chain
VRAEGSVETWLTSLLQTSQQSLHAIIRQAFIMINDLNFNLLLFLDKMPAQVKCTNCKNACFSCTLFTL